MRGSSTVLVMQIEDELGSVYIDVKQAGTRCQVQVVKNLKDTWYQHIIWFLFYRFWKAWCWYLSLVWPWSRPYIPQYIQWSALLTVRWKARGPQQGPKCRSTEEEKNNEIIPNHSPSIITSWKQIGAKRKEKWGKQNKIRMKEGTWL